MFQTSVINKEFTKYTNISIGKVYDISINYNKTKERYKVFAENENISIFMQPWWLDIVCSLSGMKWNVILYEKGGHIWGSFIYTYKKKIGFNLIMPPELTPLSGPYIKYPEGQRVSKKLSWEKEIMSYFINNLPKFDKFAIYFNHSFKNWLPFYWKGFKQTTKYTYIIKDLNNLDAVYSNFEPMARNNIKRALKNGIEVIDSEDIDALYEVNKITFEMQNVKIPYSLEYLKALYAKAKEKNSVIIKFAKKDNKVYSVMMGVYDKNTLYILLAGSDRRIKSNFGSEYLLFWEMMKFASKRGLSYDFEGSVIEGVEKRNRSFGATPKQYFKITKTPNKILKAKELISQFWEC